MRIISLAWGGQSTRALYEENLHLLKILEERDATIRVLRMAMDKVDLQHARATRDLVAHFLAAVEEADEAEALRDGIVAGLSDLNDHVARLEEHAST